MDWGWKWLVDFNAIDVKVDESVLEEKSSENAGVDFLF